jgi:hypothetical protein
MGKVEIFPGATCLPTAAAGRSYIFEAVSLESGGIQLLVTPQQSLK